MTVWTKGDTIDQIGVPNKEGLPLSCHIPQANRAISQARSVSTIRLNASPRRVCAQLESFDDFPGLDDPISVQHSAECGY